MSNIVSATIEELVEPVRRDHVMERLCDWRDRVHRLYDHVQDGLGTDYVYDRSGKHRTMEAMVQRAGIEEADVPAVDILRIERPQGTLRATLQPRYLWIVGANGRLDLLIARPSGGRRLFMIYDLAAPMSGVSDWRLVSLADRLHEPPFRVDRLQELLA